MRMKCSQNPDSIANDLTNRWYFEKNTYGIAECEAAAKSFAKLLQYPDGSYDIIASSVPVFREKGWENIRNKPKVRRSKPEEDGEAQPDQQPPAAALAAAEPAPESIERSRRRARTAVRRLALSNEFRWFVTLTLDEKKIERYDGSEVMRQLRSWLDNMVRREGLQYVLVPERHKKGGIHFHGFFNDCPALAEVDSGHKDKRGHTIYNLERWSYGFTTAIELYGSYHAAVGYVCKYIGKQDEKIGGRWYYSGGGLAKPKEEYVDISSQDIVEAFGKRAWTLQAAGRQFAGVNGLSKGEDDETAVEAFEQIAMELEEYNADLG